MVLWRILEERRVEFLCPLGDSPHSPKLHDVASLMVAGSNK
jgi:hypothetical protein